MRQNGAVVITDELADKMFSSATYSAQEINLSYNCTLDGRKLTGNIMGDSRYASPQNIKMHVWLINIDPPRDWNILP